MARRGGGRAYCHTLIILPVMVANVIAYLVARTLHPVTFFEMVASQDGLDLPSHERQREQRTLRVEDAMRGAAVGTPSADRSEPSAPATPVLYPGQSLDSALRLFASHDALAVVSRRDGRHVLGVLTLADVLRAYGITRAEPPDAAR